MNTHSLVGIPAAQKSLSACLVVLGLLSVGFAGCSSSSGDGGGAGGTPSAGGSGGKGGTGGSGAGGTTSSGGSKGTGGSMASGGTASTGGKVGSGGAVGSGGTPGTGGSNAGGSMATGGSPSDAGVSRDSAAGGSVSDASPKGGAGGGTSVGTGGSGNGGTTPIGTGTGGSGAGGGTGAKTSPGCGSASPLKTGNFTETIDRTSRKWMLDVPTNYDASKPYKMIFVWHPLTGTGSQIVSSGYNGLKSLSNGTAIFATADGLNGSNAEASGTGWWNKNGGDMKLFKAMLDKINASLCVDQERIFSTGFSFGGMMSYTLPFEFDVFRAVAPCSGKTGVIPFEEKFTGPVAIMAFHGDGDTFVQTALGKAFFDKFATRNKCGTQTQAVSPNGCNQYQGCTVPSTWCTFKGAHEQWAEEPAAIWKFFSQF